MAATKKPAGKATLGSVAKVNSIFSEPEQLSEDEKAALRIQMQKEWDDRAIARLVAAGRHSPALEEVGKKFTAGRKANTVGPVRRAIGALLKKSPEMKNAAIWTAIKANPPRGHAVREAPFGKYIEGPRAEDNMGFERFCNVCSEERKQLAR